MTAPKITIRGVRQVIPPGYVLGRLSTGDGQAELISIKSLSTHLLATGVLQHGVGTSLHPRLGMNMVGPFTASQHFLASPAPVAVTFPSASPSVAQCDVSTHGALTFYLVSNLALFLSSGAPAGVLATIAFGASATTGTITYIAQTVPQNAGLVLVMPAVADATFSGVRLIFTGDQ